MFQKAILVGRFTKDIELKISIIHTKTNIELAAYLFERFKNSPKKNLQESLIGLVNKKLILPILREVNLDKNKI